jgi:hypothetical protein
MLLDVEHSLMCGSIADMTVHLQSRRLSVAEATTGYLAATGHMGKIVITV